MNEIVNYTKIRTQEIKMRFIIFVLLIIFMLSCSEQNPAANKENSPPVILSITALPDSTEINDRITIICSAQDDDGDPLSYKWDNQTVGTIQTGDSDNTISWIAPDYFCQPWILCTVSDPNGATSTDSIQVFVFDASH